MNTQVWKWLALLLCLAVAAGSVVGCNRSGRDDTRLTEANFRQVREDMTLADVQAILGPGQQVAPPTTDDDDVVVTYQWVERERQVVVMFENGRAERITKSGF